MSSARTAAEEREFRWRMLLGEPSAGVLDPGLDETEERIDDRLAELYDADGTAGEDREDTADRRGGLGASAPGVARWLGDIRTYFPSSVVQVLQRDAVERLGLATLLVEPELLAAVQPDIHLVGALLALNHALPEETRATARRVVAQVVEEIRERIATRTVSAVGGALRRAARTSRPRPGDVDWDATIRRNLRHYLPDQHAIVPERLVGRARGGRLVAKEVIVAIDQSGSMAESMVYASVFAATLASIGALRTYVVAFSADVVDLSDRLADPVDLLFAARLGGGTDIERAVRYCCQLVTRPQQSVLVLITDLFEGGDATALRARIRELVAAGVCVLVLLALSDGGAPAYDRELAADLATLGAHVFACTPDWFPDLLAVALTGGDIASWVSAAQVQRSRSGRGRVRGSAL